MSVSSLEERVAYLEENIQALNKAATDTAKAIQALLAANQTKSDDLSCTLDATMASICPFPPNC